MPKLSRKGATKSAPNFLPKKVTMFHLLRRYLLRQITTNSTHPSPPTLLHRHFIEHPTGNYILKFITTTTTPTQQQEQELISFLQTSCRLSSASALALANKLNLAALQNPQSTVALLKTFSFSDADVAALLTRRPNVLTLDPHTSLKPKLHFFRRIGLKPKTIYSNHNILCSNLESRLVPNFEFLKSLVTNEGKLIKLLNRAPVILSLDLQKLLIPRIRALQDYKVPEAVIATVVVLHPRAFFTRFGKFEQALEEVLEMNVSSGTLMFAHALGVFAQMPKNLRDGRMETYKELGWSEDQVLAAIVRHPFCIGVSEEKLRVNSRYFKDKCDWGPDVLCVYPVVLSLSLEKRIKPRYAIWQILASKGLLKKSVHDANYFLYSVEKFLKNYVFKYQKEAPQVLDVVKSYNMELKK